MDNLKRSEISEEIRYVWSCPKCGEFNEDCEDPSYEEDVYCQGCSESFKLED